MAEDRGGDDADKTNTAQEHHHDLYHYVFIIVGSIVTAGIEFALVWPENHHLALLLIQRIIADTDNSAQIFQRLDDRTHGITRRALCVDP